MSTNWSEYSSARAEAFEKHHKKISELQAARKRIVEVKTQTFKMELTAAFQKNATTNKNTIQNTLNLRKKDIAVYEQNKLHTDACLK